MTSIDVRSTAVLRRAAVRATWAPSVHNTQPWRFRLRPGVLDIYADPTRQLRVLDPSGRQLTVSCGCALMNARVSIASSGLGAEVDRFPEPADPELVARITIAEYATADVHQLAALDSQVELRETNRRRFVDDEVPAEAVAALEAAAATEGCDLFVIRRPEHRLAAALLGRRANALEHSNPAHRAELRAWTIDDPRRNDRVPAGAVAHVASGGHDDIALRDFDPYRSDLIVETRPARNDCLVLLCTAGDLPADWLQAGEALERILLEVTRRGFVADTLTPVVEMPGARAELTLALGLTMRPQVLLRVGQAPPTPASRRRRLVDVLVETS